MKILASLFLIAIFFQAIKCFNCTGPASCNYQGFCNANGSACICSNCYTTTSQAPPGVQCDFQAKPQILIFMMSFFFGGLGVGRFLVGDTGLFFPFFFQNDFISSPFYNPLFFRSCDWKIDALFCGESVDFGSCSSYRSGHWSYSSWWNLRNPFGTCRAWLFRLVVG